MKNFTIKNTLFILGAFLIFNTSLVAQTLSPAGVERANQFDQLYSKVMQKVENGTITLDDPDYYAIRKLLRKMNSYDKYTTLKKPEVKQKVKAIKSIKETIKLGTAYLSNSKNGLATNQFTAGETIFLILKTGESIIEESMERTNNGTKKLKLYLTDPNSKNFGLLWVDVPQNKLKEHAIEIPINFDISNPDCKSFNIFLGNLKKGGNKVEFKLIRTGYSSTAGMKLKYVEIPITITVKDNKYSNFLSNNEKAAYESITLGKAATSNPKLEEKMKVLYKKSYPNDQILRLIIAEDWYDLKDGGRLNYKKCNAYAAVKKSDGNCYRVFIGYVKENISTTGGVKLGALKILTPSGSLKFTKMPCSNVNK